MVFCVSWPDPWSVYRSSFNHAQRLTRGSDFSNPELGRLAQLPMVPTRKDTGEGSKLDIRWLPPSQCFFARDSEGNFHSKLFVFVNFGTPANGFLSACGTKHEPNVEDVAQMLLKDPHGFYRLAENPNMYVTFHNTSSLIQCSFQFPR